MSYEAQSHDKHQLELLMTTIFTCRSVVKYGLTLGEEQKKDLLADIDTSLEMLRSYLLTSPSLPTDAASLQAQPTNLSPGPSLSEDAIASDDVVANNNERQALQDLYKVYHTYLGGNQDKNLRTFVSRFNDAMVTIQEIQRIVERSYQTSPPGEEPFQRVKLFIADLYYIFMEFMRALSETLQQNNVQLDTEELYLSQGEQNTDEKHLSQYNLVSLAGISEAYQKLRRKRDVIVTRIADATAFLEFLKERLGADLNRRDEFLSQLNNIIGLLHEFSCLITD